ncbi:Hint domain-containing protein [Aliiroseovarius crassostreae]|uniref:Hint domain-containing protein n=1 Tax=Aliiroseovarius crassostreae TaxID=154981 RepID=A0A9Q9HBV8_9RHOB|nr:Hint domain-containing protein [Aliiroseovarius crassostreae]UWP95006.1 Hint domain-containing protein [Aliiroseovarius crassostreae]
MTGHRQAEDKRGAKTALRSDPSAARLVAKSRTLLAGPVSWIGVRGAGKLWFNRCGLTNGGGDVAPSAACPTSSDPGPQGLIATGTIVIEARLEPWPGQPAPVLRYGAREGWLRGMMITYHPDDHRVVVDMVQGDELRRASVHVAPIIGECDLRITYSWDAPCRSGVLSVEHLEAETLHQTRFRDPLPLPYSDAERMLRGQAVAGERGKILMLGIARGIAPVALAPGLASGSLIDTPMGPRAVETLTAGDLVLSTSGEVHRVRYLASRQVPAVGLMRPMTLRAPFMGLSRDLVLSPDQRLVLTGSDAEYLYGGDAVMIQARHLHHFRAASQHETGPLIRYHAVLLDSHECLSVQGLCAESLFVGPMVPDILRTTVLSGLPPLSVPIHRLMPTPTLSQFEARNLVSAIYA